MMHLEDQEKKEAVKLKISGKQKIIRIRIEINFILFFTFLFFKFVGLFIYYCKGRITE